MTKLIRSLWAEIRNINKKNISQMPYTEILKAYHYTYMPSSIYLCHPVAHPLLISPLCCLCLSGIGEEEVEEVENEANGF